MNAPPDPVSPVHGAWAGSWGWAAFAPLLRQAGYDVTAIDLRGNGAEPPPPGEITLQLCVVHILGVMRGMGRPATLIATGFHAGAAAGIDLAFPGGTRPSALAAAVFRSLMSQLPVIAFQDLDQVFTAADGRTVHALDRVAFDIGRHEFVAVLGPSGCGKSTLLRLIAGLLTPTSGAVAIYGKPVTQPSDDIGIVFQRPTLLPWFDVLGNVTFPMRHKRGRVTPAERDRAQDLLNLVGLRNFAKKRIEELSGGMQQRVGIARALLLDPDILLMDEPFSALDALSRDEMSFELLRIWTERPKTVLFITHSIPEALLLADRVIVMTPRPGRVREVIDVKFTRPRSMATLSDPRFHELANHIRGELFSRPVAA